MAATVFADAPMLSEPKPRLSHPRIEAEITHKLLRRGKASDVADRGDEACRHRDIYACNGQKPFYRWVFETTLSNLAIKELNILGKSIEFAEVSVDRLDLIGRKNLAPQPGSTETAEKIGMRATRHEMRMQDRMDLVLDPRAMTDDLVATRYKAPQALCLGRRRPDFRQKSSRVEARQNSCVDLVGLHMRVGNRPDLQRIGDDDTRHEKGGQPQSLWVTAARAATSAHARVLDLLDRTSLA